MNNALLGKILGWGQFIFTTLGSVFAHGIPTSSVGWITILGSLAGAVGIHAASSTDGVK